MLERLCIFIVLLPRDLHRLVQLILNDFPGGRLHIFEGDRRLFVCTLSLESVALRVQALLRASRERLPHVGVPLILLVDQVVGRRYVVVSVRFEAPDRVLFFKLEVVDEPLQKIARVRHLL